MRSIRAALAIQKSIPGNLEANLDACIQMTHTAAQRGAEIILFPELNLTGYTLGKQLASTASNIPGFLTRTLLGASVEKKVTILAGMTKKKKKKKKFLRWAFFTTQKNKKKPIKKSKLNPKPKKKQRQRTTKSQTAKIKKV
eukprot:TRINITY_DN66857_c0_g1_i2.p1 TRINITY_DN66857_c0_g1~~TRINITY_DN66857_c0_g1_i2.p1  ORF type:complete len:141 (+),score=26.70 TRINITY_DN66857_c0_g1_i2:260-682(+)